MVKKFFSPELAQEAGLAMDRFPSTKEELAKAEQVLADELQKLTLQEHEQILFSVHGLPRCTLEDDYVAMEARLNELEMELENITDKDREVYDEVLARNPTYVESTAFRRLFLRSESYDAKATADKIVGHFKLKKELFGDGEILCREVCQSDLNLMDMELLEMGFMQVLSSRDVAGRAVMALSPEFMNQSTKPETLMLPLTRASWYFTMAMIQDEETQRNGAVSLMYNFCGDMPGGDLLLDAPIHQLHRVLPLRIEATHFCSSDPIQRAHVTGVQLFIDPSARFRLRAHHGTLQEINFALQTYGIPTQDSPMNDDGSWSNEWHKEWLIAQRVREKKLVKIIATSPVLPADVMANVSPQPQKDNNIDNDEIILVPRRFDVLFGKGRRERDHTGNLRAAHLCDMYMSQYESSHKFVKTEVAEKIVQIIHQSGGRFLKADNDGVGWIEVNDEAARDKIAHFFRFKRSRMKATVTPPPSSEESSTSDSSSIPLGQDDKRETFLPLTGNPSPAIDDTTDTSNQTTISAQVNLAQHGLVTASCTNTSLDLSTINLVPV